MRLIEVFLALAFGAGVNEIGFYGLLSGLSRRDLRLCLINPGQGLVDSCVLQLALPAIVFDRCPSCLDCRAGLVHLCSVIVILQFDDEIALMDLLIVADVDRTHDPRDFGAQRCKIAANIGVVRDLFRFAALPGIPVARKRNQNGKRQQNNHQGSYEFFPSGLWPRDVLSCLVLRRRFHGRFIRIAGRGCGGH